MDRLEKALEKSRQQRAALDPQLAQRQNAVEIGGKTPLDAALTELGARQAEEVMARIVYGLPA